MTMNKNQSLYRITTQLYIFGPHVILFILKITLQNVNWTLSHVYTGFCENVSSQRPIIIHDLRVAERIQM